MPTPADRLPLADPQRLLAAYFVLVWGSGYVATRIALQDASPFSFLTIRFALATLVLIPVILWLRPRWPATRAEWLHVIVAGLLMHGFNLGGSHYAQFLGLSASMSSLILAFQPLVTACWLTARGLDRLTPLQWLGVAAGLIGVAGIVWRGLDLRTLSLAGLGCALIALVSISTATLYQRRFCPAADLRSAALIQTAATLALFAPLAVLVEGFEIRPSLRLLGATLYLVVFATLLAVSALHWLMRRGQATRVTSLLYLTPVVTLAVEWLFFDVWPDAISLVGAGAACLGVWLVTRSQLSAPAVGSAVRPDSRAAAEKRPPAPR